MFCASYLLSGDPVFSGNLIRIPRWTLADGN